MVDLHDLLWISWNFSQRPWWFEWDLGTIKWSDPPVFWSFGAQRVSKVQVVKEGLVTLVLHKSRWFNCWLQPENTRNLQPEPIEHPEKNASIPIFVGKIPASHLVRTTRQVRSTRPLSRRKHPVRIGR
jgi:hypothetical protein